MMDQLKEGIKYLQVYSLRRQGKIHYSYLKLRRRNAQEGDAIHHIPLTD
jgi:hypothetical protein